MLVNIGLDLDRHSVRVNPDHVVSVRQEFHGRFLIVRDVMGGSHEVYPNYGESISEAASRIEKLMNGDPG